MIHTIGDSHSNFGWDKIGGVDINWLGPKLMFSFKETDFSVKNIVENDPVVFCYGEIDVRCHIEKHVINGDYRGLIEKMCVDYINKILNIKTQYNINKVFIYNILPTRRVETPEPYKITCENYQVYNEVKAKPYPFIGSDLQRKENTIFFNSTLKKMSKQNNLGFIDIYKKYTDEDGYLNMNLSDGTVHIGDEIYLREYITKNL
jgi:hypothetical protein